MSSGCSAASAAVTAARARGKLRAFRCDFTRRCHARPYAGSISVARAACAAALCQSRRLMWTRAALAYVNA